MVTTEIKADSKNGTQVFISAPDTCRLEKKWREREETLVTENWLFFFPTITPYHSVPMFHKSTFRSKNNPLQHNAEFKRALGKMPFNPYQTTKYQTGPN